MSTRSKTIVFLHGFASSDRGTKALYLRERLAARTDATFRAINFNPTPTDFEYMTVTGMIDRLRQFVLDHDLEPLDLIGSSLGGLVALHYAPRYGRVGKMLLLAPLLRWSPLWESADLLAHWEQAGTLPIDHQAFGGQFPLRFAFYLDGCRYPEAVAPPTPLLIIHGRNDETVPIDASRAYAGAYPGQVRLLEVDAGHDLNGHLPAIWQQVQSFLLEGRG